MPLYEYKCGQCGHVFEKLVSLSGADQVQGCPACGAEDCQKQFSTFAANTAGASASVSSSSSCGSCNSRFT